MFGLPDKVARLMAAVQLSFLTVSFSGSLLWGQEPRQPDAVQEAQRVASVRHQAQQRKSAHDRSTIFEAPNPKPNAPVTNDQPKQGKITGFDFYRDPLNADRPRQSPDEITKLESANKPKVMALSALRKPALQA